MKGLVIRSTGSFYEVKGEEGQTYTCRLKGRFRLTDKRFTNPISVGDHVDFQQEERGDTMVITRIHDRRNYIVRQSNKLSKAYHVIAANVDRLVVLATLSSPRTSTGFIDRMLVTAGMYHIDAIIIFNKKDIYTPEELKDLESLIQVYEKAGYKTMVISALDKEDIRLLNKELKNSVTILAGHSGVGKSTILNALIAHAGQKVGAISEYHSKGRHTTTFAELFSGEEGMHLIDTPGIKDFGLVFIEEPELAGYFPDLKREMSNCKFNNCLHVNEPDCGVMKSVTEGKIAEFRYVNYLNMLNELTTK